MKAIAPPIASLATQIKAEHAAVKEAARSALAHAMKCGDLLIKAKTRVRHGEWLDWLKNECNVSERISQHYMKLAKHRREVEAKSEMISDLTLSEAIKLISPERFERARNIATKSEEQTPPTPKHAPQAIARVVEDVTPQQTPSEALAGFVKEKGLGETVFPATLTWSEAVAVGREIEREIEKKTTPEAKPQEDHKAAIINSIENSKRVEWAAMNMRLHLEAEELWKLLTPEEQESRGFTVLMQYWLFFRNVLETVPTGAINRHVDLRKLILEDLRKYDMLPEAKAENQRILDIALKAFSFPDLILMAAKAKEIDINTIGWLDSAWRYLPRYGAQPRTEIARSLWRSCRTVPSFNRFTPHVSRMTKL